MASRKREPPRERTTQILLQIRDELRRTREELKDEIGATDRRLERLERRQTEDSVRLASELAAVANAVTQVRDLLREQRADQGGRLEDHERRISAR
jgi:DNA-binding XRE family transcriptional regulator